MLTSEKEALVIHYFLTLTENTVPNIAAKLEIKEHRVHQILKKYLKTKAPIV